MIVFDTDVLIDGLRNRPEAVSAIGRCAERGDLLVSVVTLFELRAGARTYDELSRLARMLSGASIRPFDEQLAWAAGAIAADLRAAGTPIGAVDAMIAATALSLDAPVCTRNVREFARVAELRIVSPAEI